MEKEVKLTKKMTDKEALAMAIEWLNFRRERSSNIRYDRERYAQAISRLEAIAERLEAEKADAERYRKMRVLLRQANYNALENMLVALEHAEQPHPAEQQESGDVCRSGTDGECTWGGCPQTRDGEPEKSGRSCPLDWGER